MGDCMMGFPSLIFPHGSMLQRLSRKKAGSNVEAVRPGRFLTTVNITQVCPSRACACLIHVACTHLRIDT